MPLGAKRGMFEGKAKFMKRRAAEAGAAAEQINRPPSNDVDTKGRPVDPRRPGYGYRGYDKSREPQKQAVADARQYGTDAGNEGSRAVRQAAESALSAKALGAADFKREIAGLSKSSSQYEEKRKELFARRQLGKRAGK